MANLVLIKNNYNAGSGSTGSPASGDLQIGEFAVDVYDDSGCGAQLYTKSSEGCIINISNPVCFGSINDGTAKSVPFY